MIFGSTIFACYPLHLFVADVALASVHGFLAFIAFYQLTRIHMRNQLVRWTRQKVLHFMIGSSNLGYSIFFITTLLATCERWFCWSHACGFLLIALPNILFLAAFLLLLSFWVDLCHQANDEEDDDGESNTQQALLDNSKSKPGSSNIHDHWRCCSLQGIHVGGRQKIVIVVVMLMFILMISFAMIIWIGAGKNPIDSSLLARVYVDIFATAVLLLGGALGCYGKDNVRKYLVHVRIIDCIVCDALDQDFFCTNGLLLFCKLRRVRSERTSSEMRKVAGLAVVSVISSSSSALIAFLTDIPFSYHWNSKKMNGVEAPVLLILHYFIGSSAPSAFLLWVMRELPPPVATKSEEQSRVIAFIRCGSEGTENPGYWATAASLKNQVSRASPI